MRTEEIHIILMQTTTLLARLIRIISREPYSHVSIALDPALQKAYSFGRKRPRFMFPAGFVVEDLPSVFRQYPAVRYGVYRLAVTPGEYRRIQKEIMHFQAETAYGYNCLGVVAAWFGLAIPRKRHYFCSQFVAHVVDTARPGLWGRPPELMRPCDYRTSPLLELVRSHQTVA